MIRDLGQPVSAIDVEEESIIAGGWDGSLKKWNGDGDLLWAAQCDDRIEAILRIDDYVIVTSGLHITCVKDVPAVAGKSGKSWHPIRWLAGCWRNVMRRSSSTLRSVM